MLSLLGFTFFVCVAWFALLWLVCEACAQVASLKWSMLGFLDLLYLLDLRTLRLDRSLAEFALLEPTGLGIYSRG